MPAIAAKLLLNKYTAGVAALAAIAFGVWWWHSGVVADYEAQVSKLQQELAASRLETVAAQRDAAAERKARAEVTENRDALQRQIERQNAAIAQLRARAREAEAAAAARVNAALLAAERDRRQVAEIPGAGPEVMNTFLEEAFLP